jgi:8-oxo-dGTP pyrophosphatase MutT (NUDIX family)
MTLQRNVLYATKWLELLELKSPEEGVHGYVCTHQKWSNGQGVAVLPYQLSQAGSNFEYLLRQEVTPCWGMEPMLSSITGGMDKEGEPPIECAARELHEEGGYIVEPNDSRWKPLGSARMSKSSTTVMHLFAVDLTGLDEVEAPGDGSELEAKAFCEWRADPENAVDVLVGRMIFGLTRKLTQ